MGYRCCRQKLGLTFHPAVIYKKLIRGKYLISQLATILKSIHNKLFPSRQFIKRAFLPIRYFPVRQFMK
jgi:hypothetical protein